MPHLYGGLPNTVAPYGRRTQRAEATLATIAMALGGRPAARLAHALGLVAAPATVLATLGRGGEAAPPLPETTPVCVFRPILTTESGPS